jgi:hypothetical protein
MPVYNRWPKRKNTREQKKRMTYICSDAPKDVGPAGGKREKRPRGNSDFLL